MTDQPARKIIAAVTAYHPSRRLVDSIRSYMSAVDEILIWQNSTLDAGLQDEIRALAGDRVMFLGTSRNVGVAEALNRCADAAERLGAAFLLTMDQDSVFTGVSAHKLIEESVRWHSRSINSPMHCLERCGPPLQRHSADRWVMTSGNLFAMASYRSIGPFVAEYFIDGIDMEWCLRARSKGFEILVHRNSILMHQLGNATIHRFLFAKTLCATNHPPFRYYYIFRNYLDIALRQTYVSLGDRMAVLKVLLQVLIAITMFESERWQKMACAARGTLDFLRGRTGASG